MRQAGVLDLRGPIQRVNPTPDSSVEEIAARALRDAPPVFLLVGFRSVAS